MNQAVAADSVESRGPNNLTVDNIVASRMLPVDLKLDARARLRDLDQWEKEFIEQDAALRMRELNLDLETPLGRQRGDQISELRQRLEKRQVRTALVSSTIASREHGYSGIRSHLVRQFAGFSLLEQHQWLRNSLFLMTDDLLGLYRKIESIRLHRAFGQSRNFLVGGDSGIGKSTFLEWFAADYLQIVEGTRNYVPLVMVNAPESRNTPRPLLQRIVLEYGATYLRHDTEEDLRQKVKCYRSRCGTTLYIVDEIENITQANVKKSFVDFSNAVRGTPIICASCHPHQFVADYAPLAGRWQDQYRLETYREDRLNALLVFISLILPFTEESDLFSQAGQIHKWTKGTLRGIMKLVLDASRLAIDRHQPCVTEAHLKEAWSDVANYEADDAIKGIG